MQIARRVIPATEEAPATMAETTPPVVAARGVEMTYPNGFRALVPVDLDVRPGEFLTLIGPSGCGKSTLLSLVAGLSRPTAGAIRWWNEGFGATGRPGRTLSMVFQDATLMPWASVARNVRLPLELAGMPRREADDRVRGALARVGLAGFGERLPRQLSGGMRMRVAIARALVTEPDLLLMDEPFGALDEFTRERLDDDLLALWRDRGMAVVFVTHSIYEAVFLSTRVVVMAARPGRIAQVIDIDHPGPRDDAFRGSPRFAALCAELSRALRAAAEASGQQEDDR